jgi:hypothetical protein
MTCLSRDPFAGSEQHRRTATTSTGCNRCGGTRKSGRLFSDETQTDGGRTQQHKGLFCSGACHDSHHC